MDVNFALEDYEVARGFVLCCQSYPVTDKVVVDFDQTAEQLPRDRPHAARSSRACTVVSR